jgi:hypothetical protein
VTPSTRSNRLVEYIRRHTVTFNFVRLFSVLLIALASILCIALDREKHYFTNVLTLIIGIIVDSPLNLSAPSPPPVSQP